MKEEFALSAAEEAKAHRVAYLISGYLRQSLSEKELDELDAWIAESDANQELFEDLTDPDVIEAAIQKQKGIDTDSALRKIKEQLATRPPAPQPNTRRIWITAIAASVLFLIGLYYFTRNGQPDKPVAADPVLSDLPPGGDKAILTLTNGHTIDLAGQQNGLLATNEGTVVQKPGEGQLVYDTPPTAGEEKFNTLSTPGGGTYRVTLSDGSNVWLNAASSLKYPVVFTGAGRQVELTGEGYFEIAKNEKQSFKVLLTNGNNVEVLGTKFNINAYSDEAAISTTLVEGSVKVSTHSKTVRLQPGEQANISGNSDITIDKSSQVSAVTAWKDGKFVFKDMRIEPIMRQVSRWYDVSIEYEGKVNYHFNATLSRNLPVSKLFQLLEKTGNVHFSITDKKIIVKP